MGKELIQKGGSKFGGSNNGMFGTTLIVNENELLLKIMFLGDIKLPKSSIKRIRAYTQIPFIRWGIKIEHSTPIYGEYIIFWSFGRPQKLLEKIAETGFYHEEIKDF